MGINLNNYKHPKKIKIRKDWGDINPVERVKESKKVYKRKRYTPQEIQDIFGIE